MAYEFKLPDLGEGLTEGEIVKWMVKVGDPIKEGEVFVQVETEKAVVEIPSPKTGTVLELRAAEGATVQVGQVLIVIGEEGEKPEAAPPPSAAKRPSVGVVGELEEAGEEAAPALATAESVPAGQEAEIQAMPAVRSLAKELNVDLRAVRGTGPKGRITKEDVQRAAQEEKPPAKEIRAVRKYDMYGFIDRVPLRGMRKSIAKAMVHSKFTAPHVTTTDEADISRVTELREKAKPKAAEKGIHLTYLPFLIKAVVAALEQHPYMNAAMDDENEEIILKKYFNIGVAVDTPDGLMVVVVKNAKEKGIFALAQELMDLSEKARSRTIDLADLKGGTFTITNYGAVGGIYGTPIIRHPEVAILGVGKILEKPVVVKGEIKVGRVLPLSLSFDHRVVDGAQAARFLNTLIQNLEDPDLILLEG